VLQLATTPCDFSSSSGPNCYSSSDAVSLPVYFSPPDNSMVTATPLSDLLVIEKLREQELEEARIIQGAMLPSQPLHIGKVIISHEFQPVTEVGGDYLDYFALSDGKIGLYVGDVSGKGLPAALYAARCRNASRRPQDRPSPGTRPFATERKTPPARHSRAPHRDPVRALQSRNG
jgi:hypothetical protein